MKSNVHLILGNPLVKKAGIYILVFLILASILYPLYIMLKISLSKPQELFQQRPPYGIHQPTLRHFYDVVRSQGVFLRPLLKSLVVGLGVSVFSLFIAVPAAWGMVHFDYRVKYIFLVIIFMSRMIPEVSIALPVSISFIKLGLFDTYAGLMLAHMIRVLPIACFIMVGVFSDFPRVLEEQAIMDGCSRFQALWRIILPLSITGITVAGIFSFLFSWDEFIYASYLTLAEPTMPLKMYYYVSRGNVFYAATYAIIITVPVVLLTLFLQKYLKPEYLSGGIKG